MSKDWSADYKARVLDAENEAKRFLRRVAAMRQVVAMTDIAIPPRENAAMKRASMDLTRALAAIRRGHYAKD